MRRNQGHLVTSAVCRLSETRILGCILLGLFWLILFRFRNNRIHGISISKRTPFSLKKEYSRRSRLGPSRSFDSRFPGNLHRWIRIRRARAGFKIKMAARNERPLAPSPGQRFARYKHTQTRHRQMDSSRFHITFFEAIYSNISIAQRNEWLSASLMAEVTWELFRLLTRSQVTGAGDRVGFPAKNFQKNAYWLSTNMKNQKSSKTL